MRKNTLTLIFRPVIRPKFPGFYISDSATKRRKERKKRISIQGVSWPNLSTDVTFTGTDFGRKKNFGLVSSATEKILKNGFHNAKEHFDLDFSAYHSAEISGILPFGYTLEKAKREKKNGFQFKAYVGRIYRQMSVFQALISAGKRGAKGRRG